jgi:AcrR family transcriptional regulator
MIDKELNTEQVILESAEAEFLEKGFGNTKTVSIARRAGVSHSMLHYYFRTKEKLFQMIFRRKVAELTQLFEGINAQGLPFEETLRLFIECQFDFMAKNPRLPRFMINEVVSNKDNLNLVVEVVKPKIAEILEQLEKMLAVEIERGKVQPIDFTFLIMNVVSLNVSTFVSLPVMETIFPDLNSAMRDAYFKKRRESNVQFILNALRTQKL